MAYVGFKALQGKIEGEGKSAGAAAAIAASIGRKKYGNAKMAKAARTRTKLGSTRKRK